MRYHASIFTGDKMSNIHQDRFNLLQKYWNAANYLTVGQIYLRDNPLLREPLTPAHVKPRLLGHWGTSPGLSFIYAHLNRLVRETDADVIYLAGPGHGGPAIVANVYLEGTYSEIYPDVSQDAAGLGRLFRQFSTPGGIPSHVSVTTPGSIHEGGELGYVLVHAFGAAFDNPELIVAAVVCDGEAETGPLAGSWTGIDFLNPGRDGAVLPILHLNGYKIAGPTVLGRLGDDDIVSLLRGHGWEPHLVEGDDPVAMHPRFAQVLDDCHARIRAIQAEARRPGADAARIRRRWTACGRIPPTSRCSSAGCGAIGRRSSSTIRAGSAPSWPRSRPAAPAASGRIRTPTAAACSGRSTCPTTPTTRCRSRARPPSCTARPASSGSSCATSSRATARRPTSASSARTRPTPTGSATSSTWRIGARCSRARPPTITWRPTAG